jgi:hypothetical protein
VETSTGGIATIGNVEEATGAVEVAMITDVDVAWDEVETGGAITGGATSVLPDLMSEMEIGEIFPALSRLRTAT